jgi:hypothetical protein
MHIFQVRILHLIVSHKFTIISQECCPSLFRVKEQDKQESRAYLAYSDPEYGNGTFFSIN